LGYAEDSRGPRHASRVHSCSKTLHLPDIEHLCSIGFIY